MTINASKAFPVGTTLSCGLTVYFRARSNAGTGTYSGSTPVAFTDLAISFPTGRGDVVTWDSIMSLVVQHLLNNDSFTSWWSPEIGTLEQNLIAAVGALTCPPGYASGNYSAYMLFDGQFGSVLAG